MKSPGEDTSSPSSRSRSSRRLWAALGLAAVAGAILLLVLGGLRQNVVYFLTPTELLAEGADLTGRAVRLGGQVQPNSVHWDAEIPELRFILTDEASSVRVHATGAPPAMFQEGLGVVVEGHLNADGVFESTRLMVKHSNEYRPPEEGEEPAHLFKSLISDEDGR